MYDAPPLTPIGDRSYRTPMPHRLCAWLRAEPLLREWSKKALGPYNRDGEISRFYAVTPRRQRGPGTAAIVFDDGRVVIEGPAPELVRPILERLRQAAAAPPPAPARQAPPPAALVLALLAGESALPPAVSVDQVRRWWRTVARVTHPDAGGQAESFIAARRAYETALAELGARP